MTDKKNFTNDNGYLPTIVTTNPFLFNIKNGCKCRVLIRKRISHPTFYGNIKYKAYKFKNDPLNLTVPLNKRKGYKFDIVVKTLNIVFVGTDINKLIASLPKY